MAWNTTNYSLPPFKKGVILTLTEEEIMWAKDALQYLKEKFYTNPWYEYTYGIPSYTYLMTYFNAEFETEGKLINVDTIKYVEAYQPTTTTPTEG